MTSKVNQDVKNLIISALRNKTFSSLNKARKDFMLSVLWHILSIKGKINFTQLGRFSPYCEQTHRIHFEQEFDFLQFNKFLCEQMIEHERILAFDPSYIPKAGKHTYGRGRFWSGSAKAAKSGLDICGFAVIDVVQNAAFHLKAWQTPGVDNPNADQFNLLTHYASLISENAKTFKDISDYMVADAYFSKKVIVDTVLATKLHFISRLRDDSVLMYKYYGEPTGKRGRPRKVEGRVNVDDPDTRYFDKQICNQDLTIYSAVVHSKAFKRDIKLAIAVFIKDGKEIARKLYFSTDLKQDGKQIVRYYRSRFQIEFLYRDAKQHTGLNDCQARSKNKLDFHFNASLTAVNLAKYDWLSNESTERTPFSMANYKTFFNNALMLERFICRFAINPNSAKNQKIVKELLEWGRIAA
jgi:hypothetical protein